MYEDDLNKLVQGDPTNSYRKPDVVLYGRASVLEQAYAITASANAKVGPARQVYAPLIKEVVIRENNARVGQTKKMTYFGILRAVENFLSVATQNNATTPHIDLLPLGHPLLPNTDESLTASAYVQERAAWEAGTLDANPQTKALVASVLANDPASAEYKFAVVRLRASAPDVLSRIV
jgi:hypothetical protein